MISVCVRVRVRALALESRLSIIDHRGLISNIGIMILMQSVVCVSESRLSMIDLCMC